MPDLSILIPARNELFLRQTIEDILQHSEADTEVLVLLDGAWPLEPLDDHPKVTLIHRAKSIGQRAAVNELARLSKAKYIAKCDAHVSVEQGFDRKLIEACEYEVTLIPRLYNLHVFDRICKACNARLYQGPMTIPCDKCKEKKGFEREIIWQPRWSRKTDFARVNPELVYQYWNAYGSRPEAQGDIADTFSFLGAFWFQHRERFWELGGLDTAHGGWGNLGTEVSFASQLSGGALKVLKTTYYSHMFRTQGHDFGMPYPLSQGDVDRARSHSRDKWTNGKFSKAVMPLSKLVEKYWPIPDWQDAHLEQLKARESKRGAMIQVKKPQRYDMIFYTDNKISEPIGTTVQQLLKRARCNGDEIISVSLKPIQFGRNFVLDRERGAKTLFLQILTGLERSTAEYVFFCEHDCLYPAEHFEFVPPRDDTYYYNENCYKVSAVTGQAVFYYTKQLSGLCANRLLLIEHYYKRLAKMTQNVRDLTGRGEKVKNDGHSRHAGWEPGCHREPRGVDNYKAERWMSSVPYIDIRDHGTNYTPTRWRQEDFRDPKACLGWTLADEVPGWGKTLGRFNEFLADLMS